MKRIRAFFFRNKLDVIVVACVLGVGLVMMMFASVLGELDEVNSRQQAGVEELLQDSRDRTDELTAQTKDIREQTEILERQDRLLACLLVVHDLNINVPSSIRRQCEQDVEDGFNQPAPNDEAPQSSSPPQQNQNNNGGNPPGGGADEPEPPREPSLFERLINPITDLLGILGL